ncbi:hypothetical protein [Streptomyces sp. NPDC046925]|uniref:hypothetical protein n=1 Tax=Streptomyces sp. NPDC046925 TaxID=3155375 RepID=UPI00340BCEF2
MTEQPAAKRDPHPRPAPPVEHEQDTAEEPVYVCVEVTPEGEVRGVDLRDQAPEISELCQYGVLRTVWLAPVPAAESGEKLAAREIMNLAVSSRYRQDAPEEWQSGQEALNRFHAEDAGERVFLRTVEAHLILAGVDNARTTLVAAGTFGITIPHSFHDLYAFRSPEGWKAFLETSYADGGWVQANGHLAPLDAEPADVAAAVQQVMADCDM